MHDPRGCHFSTFLETNRLETSRFYAEQAFSFLGRSNLSLLFIGGALLYLPSAAVVDLFVADSFVVLKPKRSRCMLPNWR